MPGVTEERDLPARLDVVKRELESMELIRLTEPFSSHEMHRYHALCEEELCLMAALRAPSSDVLMPGTSRSMRHEQHALGDVTEDLMACVRCGAQLSPAASRAARRGTTIACSVCGGTEFIPREASDR